MSGFPDGNAVKFRGVPLKAGTPTNGQVYAYVAANGDFELTSAAGGGADALDAYIVATTGGAHNNANDVAFATVNGYGTLAARPGASTEGYIYFASDTFQFYRWTSGAWQSVTPVAQPDSRFSLPVTIGQGGTGQNAKQAAFDALSPLATAGDYLVFAAGHNGILSPTLAGQAPFYDGSSATVLKVLRAQYDPGRVISNNTTGSSLFSGGPFTAKAPFTVGDKFRITVAYQYLNNSGSNTTPALNLVVGGATQWASLIPSQSTSASYRTGWLDVEFTVTVVNASGNVAAFGANWMSAANATPITTLSTTQTSFGFQTTNTLDTTADFTVDILVKPGPNGTGTASFTPIYISMVRIPVL